VKGEKSVYVKDGRVEEELLGGRLDRLGNRARYSHTVILRTQYCVAVCEEDSGHNDVAQ
jgi:hypothetical protein